MLHPVSDRQLPSTIHAERVSSGQSSDFRVTSAQSNCRMRVPETSSEYHIFVGMPERGRVSVTLADMGWLRCQGGRCLRRRRNRDCH